MESNLIQLIKHYYFNYPYNFLLTFGSSCFAMILLLHVTFELIPMRLVRLGKIIGYVEFAFIEKQFHRYIFNVSSQNSIINFMFFKTEIIPISVASLVVGG